MPEETISASIARIERAIGRIEQAAARRDEHLSLATRAYEALEAQHDTLRGRIEETITRLDRLIDQEDAA